ncbi:MAG: hypothetical protein JNL83_16525, partial [Myxococcales bacterium]|nr:hypothetical protein [Myxococcales bacterium]
MKLLEVLVVTIPVFAFAGCATSAPRAPEVRSAAHSHAAPPPATIGGDPVRSVEVPATAGAGQPREMKVLVDEPALKLVTIVLRGGTLLPEHQTAVPVTIQALHGA